MQFGTDIENVQSSMNNRSSIVSMPTCDIRRRRMRVSEMARRYYRSEPRRIKVYEQINAKQGGYVYSPLQFIAHRIVLSLRNDHIRP